MKFRAISIPKPSKGITFENVIRQTKPNDALSLREILARFTRGEPMPVGKESVFHESDLDIEKLKGLDLVERDEMIAEFAEVQSLYTRQQKEKREKAIAEEIRKQAEIGYPERLKAEQNSAPGATPAPSA